MHKSDQTGCLYPSRPLRHCLSMKFALRSARIGILTIHYKRDAVHILSNTGLQPISSQHRLPAYRDRYKADPGMSSDEAYSSFLDQANQDTGASKVSTQSGRGSTKAVDTDIPGALRSLEHYYTSDADEPFEPVSLRWTGQNMPSESRLLQPSATFSESFCMHY